jgi:hypothetical protein
VFLCKLCIYTINLPCQLPPVNNSVSSRRDASQLKSELLMPNCGEGAFERSCRFNWEVRLVPGIRNGRGRRRGRERGRFGEEFVLRIPGAEARARTSI